MARTKQGGQPSTTAPVASRSASLESQIAELRAEVNEIRELVVELLHHYGDERAGARAGELLTGDEKRISLEEAAGLFWGKSVAKDPESRLAHADILKLWATKGLNGVVLETIVAYKQWRTSAEAVERFRQRLGVR